MMGAAASTTHPRRRAAGLLTCCVAVLACGAPSDDADTGAPAPFEVEATCARPDGVTTSPRSIGEVVALVNALPMPVTLTCVLEVLDRPLSLVAAVSPFSAQPSEDPDSPRLFIMGDALIMTVVPIGDGSHGLELAEFTAPGRSLKGEIGFPVEAPIDDAEPYRHVLIGGVNGCGLCHLDEQLELQLGDVPAYSSIALAPEPERIVSPAFVEAYARDCDAETEPERCGLLAAVFGHGTVVPGHFDVETPVCLTP